MSPAATWRDFCRQDGIVCTKIDIATLFFYSVLEDFVYVG